MARPAPPNRGRRLRLAAAGAVLLTALTTATAVAGVAPVQTAVPETNRPGPNTASTRSGDTSSSSSPFPGFVLDRGRYRTIEAPDPTVMLFPFDINNRGQITGEYIRVGSDGIGDSESGFVRDKRGRLTVFDVPGAKGTEAIKVNDRGQIAGTWEDRAETPAVEPGTHHGFLWDRGRLTRFDVPGSLATGALGINNAGQITGAYDDAAGRHHGFVLRRGRYTTIDGPGRTVTDAWVINDHGEIVIPDLGTGLTPVTIPQPPATPRGRMA
jgi:hypothetical protein